MADNYTIRTTRLTVCGPGDPLFSADATNISIDDEAAGEFIRLEQSRDDEDGGVALNPGEWPHIRQAVDILLAEIEKHEQRVQEQEGNQ